MPRTRRGWESPSPAEGKNAQRLLRKLFPPMLATLSSGLPATESEWLYEWKYDGFRGIAALAGGELAFWTRNGLDLSARFPDISAALEKIAIDELVIDGEVVALDPSGIGRFELLQRGEGERSVFFVFDILWLHGHDLRALPIEERRELLERMFAKRRGGEASPVQLAERFESGGRRLFEQAARDGMEGLIAKRRGSIYESRRSRHWLKIKAVSAQEVAIVGFTPSTAAENQIGALLLGVVIDGRLRFAGKVGTGFSTSQRVEFQKELRRDRVKESPVEGAPRMRDAVWVEPRLVAQVRFTEWTAEGRLRHPSFLGLRPDKSPMECRLERPRATPEKKASAKSQAKGSESARRTPSTQVVKARKGESPVEVNLTHPERVLYPRDKITKEDVARYYAAVSEAMIPTLAGRPLALEHWNQGIDRPSWFQQNIGNEAEEWMTLVETPTRTSRRSVRHLVVDRPETLRWLAQHSVLTIHMWPAHAPSLESPDWVVFDLDPAKDRGFDQAVEAALVLRKVFDKLEIPSVPKTSGKRGIHLFVPLVPGHTHEEVVTFAVQLGEAVAAKVPFLTTERSMSKRRGRLYLDCHQNGYGKTVVAPYSLRGIDGAPVSAPLLWSEINSKLDPARFNLRSMPDRLAKLGDLFRSAIEGGIRLPRLR